MEGNKKYYRAHCEYSIDEFWLEDDIKLPEDIDEQEEDTKEQEDAKEPGDVKEQEDIKEHVDVESVNDKKQKIIFGKFMGKIILEYMMSGRRKNISSKN